PGLALNETGNGQRPEEAQEADDDQPVLPFGKAAAIEGLLEHLRDDVVDQTHAQEGECAEQGQMGMGHHEVGEVREPVKTLNRLKAALDVDQEIEDESGQPEAQRQVS